MKINIYAFSLILFILTGTSIFESQAQSPQIIKWSELQNLLENKSDTIYVFNFWATWCAPCVKELPYFEKLADESKSEKIKFIFISLDFKRQFESRLKPFVAENKMQSDVYLLDEPDYNTWIDKIDPSWNGAIPATLMINNSAGKRKFFEREFTYDQLNETLNQFKK